MLYRIIVSKSLKQNSIFYLIYTICNMLFPFITSLYVARILSPTNIGEVAYAQNIVNYFAIMAFLGLPTYGIREISIARKNKVELSRVYSELFTINFISTCVFSFAYYGLVFIYPSFQDKLLLYCVVGLSIILNMCNISWLYEGLEEFGYISMRNIIFKTIMLILVVILVQSENDIISYALITVLGTAGNGILNVIYARKFVRYSIHDLNLGRHLKPIFMLVAVNFAIEIYSLADITMLGSILPKNHVAFYSYATKVNRVILQVANTFTVILVPRISLYYSEGNFKEFNALLTKGLKIIIIFALPIIIGILFTSEFLFPALFGFEYIASASVEKILCILIFISPIGYLLGSRVMLVSNNEKRMVICVLIGAILNLALNSLLIPVLYENGAAIASVISEVIVMSLYIFFTRKMYKIEQLSVSMIKIVLSCIPVLLIQLVYTRVQNKSFISLGTNVLLSTLIYIISLILFKEPMCYSYYHLVASKVSKGKTNGI